MNKRTLKFSWNIMTFFSLANVGYIIYAQYTNSATDWAWATAYAIMLAIGNVILLFQKGK